MSPTGGVEPLDVPRLVRRLADGRGGMQVHGPNTLPVLGDRATLEREITKALDGAGAPADVHITLTPEGCVRVETSQTAVEFPAWAAQPS